jgi:hypothetical protein
MKKSLIAAIVMIAAVPAFAADESLDLNELRSADDLAQELGLPSIDSTNSATAADSTGALDSDNLLPPRPYPPHPGPGPGHPHPHPGPGPGYPHPHPGPGPGYPPPYYPAPPPPARFQCGAQDLYGYNYWFNSYDPREGQYEAHQICVRRSNGPCRDLGCRRY